MLKIVRLRMGLRISRSLWMSYAVNVCKEMSAVKIRSSVGGQNEKCLLFIIESSIEKA